MRLLRGSYYTRADGANTPPVAVANEVFVRKFIKNDEPVIGTTVKVEGTNWRIVGVVGNVQQKNGLGGDWGPVDASPQLYVPATQVPDRLFAGVHLWFSPVWMVRTRGTFPELLNKCELRYERLTRSFRLLRFAACEKSRDARFKHNATRQFFFRRSRA
jgi:hypothetical protein